MQRNSRVAVTGLGCICSLGSDVRACAEAMFRDRIEPMPPTRFRSGLKIPYPVFEVGSDLPVDTPFTRQNGLSRTGALALVAASEALRDAGIGIGEYGLRNEGDSILAPALSSPNSELRTPNSFQVGVCIGTTVGSALNSTAFYASYLDHNEPDMAPVRRFLSNNPAFLVAGAYGFSGPCQTVVNACSSGTDTIGIGASWIRAGLCDIVIAGGADELSSVTYNGFAALMVTDDEYCKPFDRFRKGLNLGEGAAMVVLESETAVRARGNRPHGFVTGYGASCDAYHLTAPSPDGSGLKRALLEALRASGRSRREIAFVNAHGTGTLDNDKVEAKALHETLPEVPFFSTKGFTGHALGAAGAIEAVLTLICLDRGVVPGNAGFSVPDPDLPAVPVSGCQAFHGKTALSESLAFGGHNSVLVLEVADE